MSLKFQVLSIVFLFSALLFSCKENTQNNKEFHHYQPIKQPLFHFYAIGDIEDAPVNFMDVWNRETIAHLGIQSIDLVVKGGQNPEDTIEKRIFQFSSHAKNLKCLDYKYDESPDIWSVGELNWKNDNLTIHFTRHFGLARNLQTSIRKTPAGFLVLRQKKSGLADSTFVYGTIEHPSAIVTKIGKSIFSVQIFMPQSSSTSELAAAFTKYGLDMNDLLNVDKSVIFLDKGLPVSAFQLDENCSQISQIKTWEYSDKLQLINYKEYIANSVIREMEFVYRNDGLPSSMNINGKTYLYSYQ